MPTIPTQWVTDIVKNPTINTPILKGQTGWGNHDVKTLSSYTPATKNIDAWGHTSAKQTVFYTDRFIYNDPLKSYNYLLNGNTNNPLGQTAWSHN